VSEARAANVRFYFDADVLGVAKVVAALRYDVTSCSASAVGPWDGSRVGGTQQIASGAAEDAVSLGDPLPGLSS